MISLIVDTACQVSVVALAKDGVVFSEKKLEGGFLHSRYIFSVINELCTSNNILPKDFSYVAAGVGPGSYTGIRVGVSALKGISFALGIPIVGVCTLTGFVPDLKMKGTFLAALDAKIGGVYVLRGYIDGERVSYSTGPEAVSLDVFQPLANAADCVVTQDWNVISGRLTIEKDIKVIEKSISSNALAWQAHQAFCDKKYFEDGRVEILYLRKTQAEIEREMLG